MSTALPVVFVAGLQNGTTTKVDLVAGYEEENNACTGQAFNFKGDHYWKHMLYSSVCRTRVLHSRQPIGTQESWRSELAGATSVAMKPCPAAKRTFTSRRR